jgi:UDP-2,4-diacetamido-2,4,6-trideoxy-beta-L-altropyranose hydrolase
MVGWLDEKADRQAVFVCSASLTVGGGHIMRCMTLANQLSSSGWRCAFTVNPEATHVVSELERSGFYVEVLPEGAWAEDLAKPFPEGAELLVVDHYGLGADFESSCRDWAKKILVIDDLANRTHNCDLLLDTTPGRTEESYQALVPKCCRFLLGPDYALLRDEFALSRTDALIRREQKTTIDRILVSFGLTDPAGTTADALRGVLEFGATVAVDVVLNQKAPGYQRVAYIARENENVDLLGFVDDMAGIMVRADLAVGAAGTTSWERCCLGLPTILIVLAANQEMNAKELENAGAAVNLGRNDIVGSSDVAHALAQIDGDRSLYQSMSRAAAGLCDGRGAERVVAEIMMEAESQKARCL